MLTYLLSHLKSQSAKSSTKSERSLPRLNSRLLEGRSGAGAAKHQTPVARSHQRGAGPVAVR